MAAFRLTSPAFEHDEELPVRYTGDGEDVSPPLEWFDVPAGTKELVVVCDDPDADPGVFTHWMVYGIAPDTAGLPENVPKDAVVEEPVELLQGLNEYDEVGWSGPVTDEERAVHRYFFRLYALDAELVDLPPGATRAELRKAAKDHVIAVAELVGLA